METYYKEGEALLAERIAVQARRIDKVLVKHCFEHSDEMFSAFNVHYTRDKIKA